jgi:hypothetical protein
MGLDTRAMGVGYPGRGTASPDETACLMCPASKKPEVEWLGDADPDLAVLSVLTERRAHERELRTTRGLGRRWSWSEYLGHGEPSIPLVP